MGATANIGTTIHVIKMKCITHPMDDTEGLLRTRRMMDALLKAHVSVSEPRKP